MDGSLLDRITRALADGSPRRRAVQVLTGAGFVAVASRLGLEGSAAKNRRCRKRLQKCGGKKKCCNGSGKVACQAAVKPLCQQAFPGQRCCGKEGAPCSSGEDDCQCCGELFCSSDDAIEYRCREVET